MLLHGRRLCERGLLAAAKRKVQSFMSGGGGDDDQGIKSIQTGRRARKQRIELS
jgi:hypothetical protein